LNDISLTINEGEFVLLLGLNSSGKTTALNIITGVYTPSEGQVELFGNQLSDNLIPREIKERMGIVFSKVELPEQLTVEEIISLFQSYYSNPFGIDEAIKLFELKNWRKTLLKNQQELSQGRNKRLLIALALSGNPDLLLFDEPTANLDPPGRRLFWQLMRDLSSQGKTILICMPEENSAQTEQTTSTIEDLSRARELATRIVEFNNGEIVSDTVISSITNQVDSLREVNVSPPNKSFEILKEQVRVEFLQLWRKPMVLVFSLLLPLFIVYIYSNMVDKQLIYQQLIAYAILGLLIISIQTFGTKVAEEKTKGWMKLLQVTPLPPPIYIVAKIIVAIFISGLCLALLFSFFAVTLDFDQPFLTWLFVFCILIVGMIPLNAMMLALGYWIDKDIFGYFTLPIMIVWIVSGLILPIKILPKTVQNLLPYLPIPTYHYAQIALWAGGIPSEKVHIWLDWQWLIWATVVFGMLAAWGYQRSQIDQKLTWWLFSTLCDNFCLWNPEVLMEQDF